MPWKLSFHGVTGGSGTDPDLGLRAWRPHLPGRCPALPAPGSLISGVGGGRWGSPDPAPNLRPSPEPLTVAGRGPGAAASVSVERPGIPVRRPRVRGPGLEIGRCLAGPPATVPTPNGNGTSQEIQLFFPRNSVHHLFGLVPSGWCLLMVQLRALLLFPSSKTPSRACCLLAGVLSADGRRGRSRTLAVVDVRAHVACGHAFPFLSHFSFGLLGGPWHGPPPCGAWLRPLSHGHFCTRKPGALQRGLLGAIGGGGQGAGGSSEQRGWRRRWRPAGW